MNINSTDTKASARSLMEKHFPRVMLNYRILRKTGFEKEMALLPELCDQTKISLDIGANIGMFTWHLKQHSRSVIAFEPNPYLSGLLQRTFKDRVPVRQVALSNQRGTASLCFPNDEHALGSLGAIEESEDSVDTSTALTSYDVETFKLDDLSLAPVGFMKIDVEGHELEVLEGAQQTLVKHRPNLLVEVEERHRAGAVHEVIELLQSWGYAGSFMIDCNIQSVSSFNLDEHQNSLNLDEQGNRIGTYINNFIFTPAK